MALVAGVDSSTQSTKVEIRDAEDGRLVAAGRAGHPPTSPPRSEQDPKAWWDALEQALGQALDGAGVARVDAIAVAGQQHGMVVLDSAGAVIRPAKLWNDTESAPDASWLTSRGPGDAAGWASACGSVLVAAFTITKLSWLHRNEPEHFDAIARVLLPHDYLTWRLGGRFVTDRGDASGTGYWSPGEERYRYDLLEVVSAAIDWPSVLPEVLGPSEAAAEIDGLLVAPGTGDNMGAALGLGLAHGQVVVSLGTSGTVYTVANGPTSDGSGAVAGFADATGRYLPLVCTLNATKVTDTIGRLLGVDHGALDALALAAPVGAGGLTLLPYLDGERTPNRPDATGTLSGLRTATSREQLARAAYEGVVCGLLDGFDALGRAGVAIDQDAPIVLVGGGARSSAYPRVLADLAQRPVLVPAEQELVASGACVQAAAVLHGRAPHDVAAAWRLGGGSTIDPDPSHAAAATDVAEAYAARRDADEV